MITCPECGYYDVLFFSPEWVQSTLKNQITFNCRCLACHTEFDIRAELDLTTVEFSFDGEHYKKGH